MNAMPEAPEPPGTGAHPWYVVSLLAFAGGLSYLDRQIMGIMVEPVKQDLGLTDLQISLLQGLAFTAFYSLMALPLGYLADRLSRRSLIGIGVLLWSIATAACGLTRSFAQLFLARMSVGIGEASLAPAAHSLLPDYFTRRQLPRAFAIFQMGQYVGGGGAYAIGGLIFALASTIDPVRLPLFGPLAPWQLTFLVAAAPGPIVALLMFSVREPTRRRAPVAEPASGTAEGFADHWRRNRGFLFCHLGAAAILGLVAHGIVSWAPSFFIRGFGWTPADVGIAYGTMLIVAGGSGTLFAALLARRWQDAGHRGSTARVALFATVASVPFAIGFPLSGSPIVAMGCLFVFSFCTGVTSTMLPTVLQLATPPAFRGRMGGLYVVATTAVGAALGPIAVAVVTDLVIGDPSRLNQSIAIVCGIFGPLAIALSLGAYRYFARIPDDAPQSPIANEPQPIG